MVFRDHCWFCATLDCAWKTICGADNSLWSQLSDLSGLYIGHLTQITKVTLVADYGLTYGTA